MNRAWVCNPPNAPFHCLLIECVARTVVFQKFAFVPPTCGVVIQVVVRSVSSLAVPLLTGPAIASTGETVARHPEVLSAVTQVREASLLHEVSRGNDGIVGGRWYSCGVVSALLEQASAITLADAEGMAGLVSQQRHTIEWCQAHIVVVCVC